MSVHMAHTSSAVSTELRSADPTSAAAAGSKAPGLDQWAPVAPVLKDQGTPETRERTVIRLHANTKERAKYWADKANVSVNEYMAEAVEEKIRRENGDYDLPTLEIARLGQLIDEVRSLSVNVGNLESVTNQGFDSLMGLTRGDNYLLDPEDGEIGAGS